LDGIHADYLNFFVSVIRPKEDFDLADELNLNCSAHIVMFGRFTFEIKEALQQIEEPFYRVFFRPSQCTIKGHYLDP
jgi:hypothetical protein